MEREKKTRGMNEKSKIHLGSVVHVHVPAHRTPVDFVLSRELGNRIGDMAHTALRKTLRKQPIDKKVQIHGIEQIMLFNYRGLPMLLLLFSLGFLGDSRCFRCQALLLWITTRARSCTCIYK